MRMIDVFENMYRNGFDEGYKKGRVDAINNFVELINEMPTYENDAGEIMPMPVEMIAEQLKEKK